jgi:aryl-alcohol dehydrogenase-like predicted oxidoreductase
VLHHPAVTSAIVGARLEAQVDEIAGSTGSVLSDADFEKINLLSKNF